MENAGKCRLCFSSDLEEVIDLGKLPISHNLRRSLDQEERLYRIHFHYCKNCGLLQICDSIDPGELYNLETSTTGHQTPLHIDDMITTVLRLKDPGAVLDIGCNDGSFLNSIESYGFTKLVGIEPNQGAAAIAEKKSSHRIYKSYFSPILAEKIKKTEGSFDFVFARHVLEHVTDLHTFLQGVDTILSDDGIVVIELPRVEVGFEAKTPVILWEEHVSYFTESIMPPLLRHFGLEVINKSHYAYGGGSVAYVARRTTPKPLTLESAKDFPLAYFQDYAQAIADLKAQINGFIEQVVHEGYTIALYGAGPRSCVLLNYAGVCDKVDVVVDDRAAIHGYYMPGTNKKILGVNESDFGKRPVIALLGVGAEYEHTVLEKLHARLGYTPISVSMFPPRDIRESIAQAALEMKNSKSAKG